MLLSLACRHSGRNLLSLVYNYHEGLKNATFEIYKERLPQGARGSVIGGGSNNRPHKYNYTFHGDTTLKQHMPGAMTLHVKPLMANVTNSEVTAICEQFGKVAITKVVLSLNRLVLSTAKITLKIICRPRSPSKT